LRLHFLFILEEFYHSMYQPELTLLLLIILIASLAALAYTYTLLGNSRELESQIRESYQKLENEILKLDIVKIDQSILRNISEKPLILLAQRLYSYKRDILDQLVQVQGQKIDFESQLNLKNSQYQLLMEDIELIKLENKELLNLKTELFNQLVQTQGQKIDFESQLHLKNSQHQLLKEEITLIKLEIQELLNLKMDLIDQLTKFENVTNDFLANHENLKAKYQKEKKQNEELHKQNIEFKTQQEESLISDKKKESILLKLQIDSSELPFVKTENRKLIETNERLQKQLISYEKDIQDLSDIKTGIKTLNEEKIEKMTSIYADYKLIHYELFAKYQETKERPARARAKEVRELRQETKEYIQQYKNLLYRFETIIQLFPELKHYAEDFEALKDLDRITNLQSLQDDFDRVHDFMSKEEYFSLEEDQRNQIALDRYIKKSNKSKWQIGRDYEMSCGHWLKTQGYLVQYFGIEQRLSDLGRDLIAVKNDEHFVIQCKYWSQEKVIHEKHITQLFGTTIEYELNKLSESALIKPFKKVTPMFLTNIKLSETALRFAKRLDVLVHENLKMIEFPRIKCNSGQDEKGNIIKIYHLPFDQQYDRTIIKNSGDCYVFTVKEATEKGYRRAFKHQLKKT